MSGHAVSTQGRTAWRSDGVCAGYVTLVRSAAQACWRLVSAPMGL